MVVNIFVLNHSAEIFLTALHLDEELLTEFYLDDEYLADDHLANELIWPKLHFFFVICAHFQKTQYSHGDHLAIFSYNFNPNLEVSAKKLTTK